MKTSNVLACSRRFYISACFFVVLHRLSSRKRGGYRSKQRCRRASTMNNKARCKTGGGLRVLVAIFIREIRVNKGRNTTNILVLEAVLLEIQQQRAGPIAHSLDSVADGIELSSAHERLLEGVSTSHIPLPNSALVTSGHGKTQLPGSQPLQGLCPALVRGCAGDCAPPTIVVISGFPLPTEQSPISSTFSSSSPPHLLSAAGNDRRCACNCHPTIRNSIHK